MFKRWFIVLLVCFCLLLPSTAFADNYVIKPPLILVADDHNKTYLGKLTTNEFDADSIYNQFGTYGNKFSSTSIWNEFGVYGNQFSSYSPFNQFTTTPPIIIDGNGNMVGRLSVNKFAEGAVSPYQIYGLLLMFKF
jgi:hypothetical protein